MWSFYTIWMLRVLFFTPREEKINSETQITAKGLTRESMRLTREVMIVKLAMLGNYNSLYLIFHSKVATRLVVTRVLWLWLEKPK